MGSGLDTIDFGVVNYNGGNALRRCVDSILAQDGPRCRVWVLDNGSTDGSVDGLERDPDRVTILRTEENLGYAGALNRLLEVLESPVVVLSNMDVEYEPGWARAVSKAMADPAAAGAVTVVLEDTDPAVLNSLGVRFWADLHAQNVGSGVPYREGKVGKIRGEAFGGYGAVMCLRRDVARSVGFDDDYFLFFEETDFFLRLHLSGHRMVFVEQATARHIRSLSTKRYSLLKLYYGERNRLTTVFKLLPVGYWPLAFGHTLGRLFRLARSAEARGEKGSASGETGASVHARPRLPAVPAILWTLILAWTSAVGRLPSTLRKRRAFWRRCPSEPGDALALIRRYRLAREELRLR